MTSKSKQVKVKRTAAEVRAGVRPTKPQLLALWELVEKYRDKHNITCEESVYQRDAGRRHGACGRFGFLTDDT